MDSFSYFIAFYSLILGLALTELLGGFEHLVRAKALRKLEPQTALLALFILIDICSTWVDSWLSLKDVTVNFAGLWAPVLLAICFYLAAAVVFPRDEADHDLLAGANTIIYLGKQRNHDGKLIRALHVGKHRGSACSDAVVPYVIEDGGLRLT